MKRLLILAAMSVVAATAFSSSSFGKGKVVSFGCTMDQLVHASHDAASGRACAKAQEDAILNNTRLIAFVCTSSGIYCCPEGATSSAECSKVSLQRAPNTMPLSEFLKSGKLQK
jgi:hypothetical protein